MITAEECRTYKEFVDLYQSYLYPLLGARLSRMYSPKNKSHYRYGHRSRLLSIQLAKRTNAHVHAVDITRPCMKSLKKKLKKRSKQPDFI
ncbi:S-adenosylmethionine-dependent methyltransferase [Bacillus subtilis]|nr:S-adenosylmethionine-dependent methyltransferase [Bacillus subtilis]